MPHALYIDTDLSRFLMYIQRQKGGARSATEPRKWSAGDKGHEGVDRAAGRGRGTYQTGAVIGPHRVAVVYDLQPGEACDAGNARNIAVVHNGSSAVIYLDGVSASGPVVSP